MAYIHDVEVDDAAVASLSSKEEGLSWAHDVVWKAYHLNKHRKLGFGLLGKLVRLQYVSDLRWFVVLLVGEE